MTHNALVHAASLASLCLVGCTDQKILLGNGGQVALFTPPTAARQLAVDAHSLYWLSWDVPPPAGWQGNESSLVYVTKADKDGGNATVIARTGFSSDDVYSNYALQIDATHAYFSDTGFIAKARLDGSGVTTIVPVSAQESVGGVALDDGMIYWTQNEGLMELSKAGGTPTVLSADTFVSGQVAVDANSVYWIDASFQSALNPTLLRVDKSGRGQTQVATATSSASLLGEDASVYVEADDVVKKIESVGGPPTVVMSGATVTSDLARDVDSLYVVTDHATIVKIAKADYSQTMLVQGAAGDPNITNLAVDDTNVYWSDANGNISSVAKN